MNLIEKYGVDAQCLVQRYGGIEKCREIVEKAPEGAECYSWRLGDSGVRDNTVYLDDLRAAIADHDRIDTCTDIRNHISPKTRVSEAHVNEAYKLNRLG